MCKTIKFLEQAVNYLTSLSAMFLFFLYRAPQVRKTWDSSWYRQCLNKCGFQNESLEPKVATVALFLAIDHSLSLKPISSSDKWRIHAHLTSWERLKPECCHSRVLRTSVIFKDRKWPLSQQLLPAPTCPFTDSEAFYTQAQRCSGPAYWGLFL